MQVPLLQNNVTDAMPIPTKLPKMPSSKDEKRKNMLLPNVKRLKHDQSDIWTDIMDLEQQQERELREKVKLENDRRREKWREELRTQKMQKESMLQELKKKDQRYNMFFSCLGLVRMLVLPCLVLSCLIFVYVGLSVLTPSPPVYVCSCSEEFPLLPPFFVLVVLSRKNWRICKIGSRKKRKKKSG
jgi:hypothetical protein